MRTPTGRLPSQPNLQRIPAALTPGDHSLVNQLRASALLAVPKPRCPVCGAQGYKRIARLAGTMTFWCRRGHPHYLPGAD